MDDPLEQGRLLVDKLRTFVGILRNSPAEIVTAALALLCFSVATAATNNDFLKQLFPSQLGLIRNGLYAASAVLFVWTVLRVWKQALPPALPEQETRPSAVKGPMPFTQEDGELFRALGRRAELEGLLAHVFDDQIPLVAVMGESGAGKTSLLRAGLPRALEKRKVRLVYWEALPTNLVDRLVHAIQAGGDASEGEKALRTLDETIRVLEAGPDRTVIVLDQFEQLTLEESPTHKSLFESLKAYVSSAMPPYQLTWVVAFRRDYDPSWRDFELSIPGFHPPMVSVRLFNKERAREVMAALAAAADFTLDDELITDVIEAAADREERVSPVDIGIAMLVLSGLALQKNRRHLNKDDYRFAGFHVFFPRRLSTSIIDCAVSV